MGTYKINNDTLTTIANSLRAKYSTEETMTPDNMALKAVQLSDAEDFITTVLSANDNTSLVVPEGVTSLGSQGKYPLLLTGNNWLHHISLPSSLTYIGAQALYRATGLEEIVIPESVKFIGSKAFMGCTGLTSAFIPKTVETIENKAFYGCDPSSLYIYTDAETDNEGWDPTWRLIDESTEIEVHYGIQYGANS